MGNGDPVALVVGAGPVGLVMAHELARHGVACRIVDKSPEASTHSKALALQARTVETLHLMGIVERFTREGHRVVGGRVMDGGRLVVHLGFETLDSSYPFVLIVPQNRTEALLAEALAHQGVSVERSTELVSFSQDGDGVTAQVRGPGGATETVRANWLIGCDGAHSTTRHGLDLAFEGAEYADRFLLADVKIDGPIGLEEFHVFADAAGAMALFPMPGGRWRIIADDPPTDFPDQPDLQHCQALVDARGHRDLRLSDAIWTSVFRIHHRWVNTLRVGRVFLAGDAAHIHSPAGGQGMNTGMQDAFNLAWKIGLVHAGVAGPSLLESYEAERLPVDHDVVKKTDRMTRAISLKNPIARWARDVLLPTVTRVPGVLEKFRASIAQIDYGYRHSAIVEEHAVEGDGPKAGDRAPDAMLSHPGKGGEAPRLFDLLASGQHTLLLLSDSGEMESALIDAISTWSKQISICSIAHRGEAAEWVEVDGSVSARYGAAPAAYLVRPDGYVGFRCPLESAAALLPAYLRRVMGN